MKNKLLRYSSFGIFWGWNLILVLLTVFLLFPEMILPIVTGAIAGSVFMEQAVFSLLLFIIPLLVIIVALTKPFRHDPKRLFKLFYGIELPLFFLIIARLTLFRELHFGTLHLLILSLLAIIAYAWLFFSKSHSTPALPVQIIRQFMISCSVILALYLALFLLIFFFPIAKVLVFEFFKFQWLSLFFEAPLVLLVVAFVLCTGTLLLGLPIMLILLYSRAFMTESRLTAQQFGIKLPIFIMVFTLLLNAGIFYQANKQAQYEAFALLDKINCTTDTLASPMVLPLALKEEQKQRLLEKQDTIRQGLLNAYLASYRYLSSVASSNMIKQMYSQTFSLKKEGLPETVQSYFNALARPFLYQGKWQIDAQRAECLYQYFFDTSIEKAEYQAINQALKSNWYRDGMQAGLININQQKVLITQQSVNIEEYAHSARITLTEHYENQTFAQQEIYYYFSLPEEAVLTGVWLSDDASNLHKYDYTIAPRGAAQTLYKQERARRADPALLEQVGPRQYRLRVFPIPAKKKQYKALQVEIEPLFMQLRYDMPLGMDKHWKFPQLLEKRNVYWNDATLLSINNQAVPRPHHHETDRWLPKENKAQSATPLRDEIMQMAFNNQQVLTVQIKARDTQKPKLLESVSDTTLSLALLIDTSFSMTAIKERLATTLDSLKQLSQHTNVTIDFYALTDDLQVISAKQLNELVLFGHSSTAKQLKQWQQSDYAQQSYDALLLLTDQGNYESSEKVALISNKKMSDKKVPLWIVHLGEQPAYAYEDNLLSYIYQSGGGITDTIHEVITRVIWQKQTGITETAQISEHYLWAYSWSDEVTKPTKNENLSAIVAHQWISANFNQRLDNGAEQVAHLDDLHYLAKRYSLVSPFSSMMVLVNKRQEEALSKLSSGDERFERSVETGKKSIIKGGNLFAISSVPEPEEWALLMVVFLILSGHLIRKNQLKRKLFA